MCRGKQFGMFPPCSCIFRSFVLSSHATVTVVGAVSISFFPAGELNALVHRRPLPLSTPPFQSECKFHPPHPTLPPTTALKGDSDTATPLVWLLPSYET